MKFQLDTTVFEVSKHDFSLLYDIEITSNKKSILPFLSSDKYIL